MGGFVFPSTAAASQGEKDSPWAMMALGLVARDPKAAFRGAAVDKDTLNIAFHHTDKKWLNSIKENGLRPNSYATPTGNLTGFQAHIELGLPPNRAIPNGFLSIDLKGMRDAGFIIPTPRRVSNVVTGVDGRVYRVPGGGTEIQFP